MPLFVSLAPYCRRSENTGEATSLAHAAVHPTAGSGRRLNLKGPFMEDDDDIPTLTSIRMYEGRVSEEARASLEPVDSIETSPLGGVELTIVLEWSGGRGRHRLEFQVGNDDRRGGDVNTSATHSTVIHIASQQASGVTVDHPRTYPIYFWWDGIPAGQRFLTVRRRR